jgi:hypothetical protein
VNGGVLEPIGEGVSGKESTKRDERRMKRWSYI